MSCMFMFLASLLPGMNVMLKMIWLENCMAIKRLDQNENHFIDERYVLTKKRMENYK